MSLSVHVNFGTRGWTILVHDDFGTYQINFGTHVFVVQFRYIVMSISVHEQCSWMLNLYRWDLYIRHFFLFSRHQTETATDDAVTLRRLSRCKWSRLLCVGGCLAKPVCISKYCDIKRLPSTAALLAIPVGLHRAQQRAACLTSLLPAPTRVRIFHNLKTKIDR